MDANTYDFRNFTDFIDFKNFNTMSTEHNNDLLIRDIRAIYERLQLIDDRFDEFGREHATSTDFDHASRRIDVLEDILDIMNEQ